MSSACEKCGKFLFFVHDDCGRPSHNKASKASSSNSTGRGLSLVEKESVGSWSQRGEATGNVNCVDIHSTPIDYQRVDSDSLHPASSSQKLVGIVTADLEDYIWVVT